MQRKAPLPPLFFFFRRLGGIYIGTLYLPMIETQTMASRILTSLPVSEPDSQLTLHPQSGATLYTLQLALNLVWMPLFFTLKRPILATIDVATLTGVVGYMTYLFGQVDAVAGWCLAPYLGWLGFATYLSAGCGYLNDWDLSGGRQVEGKGE